MEKVILEVGNKEGNQRVLITATLQKDTALTGRLPKFLCSYRWLKRCINDLEKENEKCHEKIWQRTQIT